jgi:teichuronic acid biosynthesis glycosyltransferase TuaH
MSGPTMTLAARPAPRTGTPTVDVVYAFSNVTWQAACRRGFFGAEDRLVRSLLASERIGSLLICNHARSLPVKLIRDVTGADRAPFPADDRTWLLEPLRLRRRDPASIGAVTRGFAWYDRALERAAHRHGLRDPVVITGHPLVAGFSPLSWARSVTWYAVDDWAEHPAYQRWWSAYRASYDRVRDSGRRVAAVSSVLLDRLAPTGAGAVVPNGIAPAEWTTGHQPPEWVARGARPLFVYVGALDSRIDIDWLRALAVAEPAATIALVGPLVEPGHLAPLRALPNVQFHPPVPRQDLAAVVGSADVGLLPHISSRLTQAMSPLKLLEYLAAGLPVAATDLPPVRAFGHPRVALAPAGGDYIDCVRRAQAIGRAPEPERLAFIESNSWRARHDQLLELALAS